MRLLDGSPGLWIYPIELNYLTVFRPRTWKGRAKRVLADLTSLISEQAMTSLQARQKQALRNWTSYQLKELDEIYLHKLVEPMSVEGDPLRSVVNRLTGNVTRDLEAYLDAIRSCYDKRFLALIPVLMFKSIEVADLPRYATLFPSMKFIHLLRHPYSNYSSLKRTDMVLKQKPFWFQGGDILKLQLEARWIPHAEFVFKGLATEPDRHYLVRYEDICAAPRETVKGICSWLGVDLPRDPDVQTVLGGKRLKELPINSSLKGVDTPAQVVSDMAKQYSYDDVLTERESELILLRTFKLGREVGYFSQQDEAKIPSRWSLLRRWIKPDRWEYMNAVPGIRLILALIKRRLYLCRVLLVPRT
jgi:hypothetical protein